MHNHNNNDNSFSWMMGLMMLCCLLPLVLVFFGGQALLTGSFRWWMGALMLGFMAWHFWSMRKGNCHSSNQQTVSPEEHKEASQDKDKATTKLPGEK